MTWIRLHFHKISFFSSSNWKYHLCLTASHQKRFSGSRHRRLNVTRNFFIIFEQKNRETQCLHQLNVSPTFFSPHWVAYPWILYRVCDPYRAQECQVRMSSFKQRTYAFASGICGGVNICGNSRTGAFNPPPPGLTKREAFGVRVLDLCLLC